MEEYFAPAIVVAIVGLILQGLKSAIDICDRAITMKSVKRNGNIALFVALMQIVEATNFTQGEVLEVKRALVKLLLADTLSKEVLQVLDMNNSTGIKTRLGYNIFR